MSLKFEIFWKNNVLTVVCNPEVKQERQNIDSEIIASQNLRRSHIRNYRYDEAYLKIPVSVEDVRMSSDNSTSSDRAKVNHMTGQ
jgi:hypothetical protein